MPRTFRGGSVRCTPLTGCVFPPRTMASMNGAGFQRQLAETSRSANPPNPSHHFEIKSASSVASIIPTEPKPTRMCVPTCGSPEPLAQCEAGPTTLFLLISDCSAHKAILPTAVARAFDRCRSRIFIRTEPFRTTSKANRFRRKTILSESSIDCSKQTQIRLRLSENNSKSEFDLSMLCWKTPGLSISNSDNPTARRWISI